MKIDGVTFDNVTISACPHGEVLFDTPGTFNWVAPAGVTSISAVVIGPGATNAGGGGGLTWVNGVSVIPGTSYTVEVGAGGYTGFGTTNFSRIAGVCLARGGTSGGGGGGAGGTLSELLGGASGYGGGSGGGWGGGAGGYLGAGGVGYGNGNSVTPGANGSGGGGAGGGNQAFPNNGGGGGTGVYGQGSDGIYPGGGGSGGGTSSAGGTASVSGSYGGGGVYGGTNKGAGGAVRIIWGTGRSFPSTNVGRVTDYGFDVVRPTAWMIDATNPASYTSAATALNDVSGNNINGTVTAGTALSGAGIAFNGSSQTANFGNVLPSIAGNAFSFGCWVKFNNVTTAQTVMGKQSATGRWIFSIRSNGYIDVGIGGNFYYLPSGPGSFTAGTWTHVTITMSAIGNLCLYFNAVQITAQDIAAPVTSSTGSVYIGSAGASGYLNGSVGEAFFYRKALTADEVLQNYTNTKWKYGF